MADNAFIRIDNFARAQQLEYSTDLVFTSEAALKPIFEPLSRQAVIVVKAENVSSFLGKKVTPQLAQEIGSRLSTRY